MPSIHIILSHSIIGASLASAAKELYDQYQIKKIIDNEKTQSSPSNDILRKKKIIASVYNTIGTPVSPNQVHFVYNNTQHTPSFHHSLFNQDLYLKLPFNKELNISKTESELIAACAVQAAHDKKQHDKLKTIATGGLAGLIFSMSKYLGLVPNTLMCIGYVLMLPYLQKYFAYKAETTAIEYFPDYADEMIENILKTQKNPNKLSIYNHDRVEKIKKHRSDINTKYKKTYTIISRWMSLHRRRFDAVKPLTKYPHPLTRAYKEKGLHFNKSHYAALNILSHSARIYIPENIEQIILKFFETYKQQNTPLGKLYNTMSFSDFIERLITKTYKAVYLDGRILWGRNNHEDRLFKSLPNYPNAQLNDNWNLLKKVGSNDDTEMVCYDYLSLEEIGIKSLLISQAVCLPIGDGRRDTEYSENSETYTDFQLPIIDSLIAAERRPVVVATISGIEARNGRTLHPDLFIIFSPKKPNKLWAEAVMNLKKSPYYTVANQIYGDKLAIDYLSSYMAKDSDFILFGNDKYDEEWYICAPAYKYRMKLLYRNLLMSADKQMQAYDLGHAYNLKGLGLGYFGFSSATSILEKLCKEALNETLTEIKLQHITHINLINWPSQIYKIDNDVSLNKQTNLQQISTIGSVKIFEGIAEPFAEIEGNEPIGGSHACSDAASQFGNEAHIGMPPSSSDDAATYYALLDPTLLIPDENPEISLRIKR